MAELSTKEKLILASMEEIRLKGIQGFSLRRVAKKCGVSCAAPYKHFASKQEVFSAMVGYVNDKWRDRLRDTLKLGQSVERTIADTVADYVEFLSENPPFRAVLMIKETGLDSPVSLNTASMSVPVRRMFVIYRRKKNLSGEELRARIFIIRSLIYGSTLILDSERREYDKRIEILRSSVIAAL